jgi:hypothetical protein
MYMYVMSNINVACEVYGFLLGFPFCSQSRFKVCELLLEFPFCRQSKFTWCVAFC